MSEFDRASVSSELRELANVFFSCRFDAARSPVGRAIIGECEATEHPIVRTDRCRVNGKLYLVPVLHVHPDSVRNAWSLVESRTLLDCVVISAEIVDEGRDGSGPIIAWGGVRYGNRQLQKHSGFVARCCGTLVTGSTITATILNASRYRTEIGEVDWNAANIVSMDCMPRLRGFNGARIKRIRWTSSLAVELHCEQDEAGLWGYAEDREIWRPTTVTVFRMDDGNFVEELYFRSLLLAQAREKTFVHVAPAVEPIAEDDLQYLSSGSFAP